MPLLPGCFSMKKVVFAIALFLGWVATVWAAPAVPLTTLRAIHALSNAEAAKKLPVAFEATVTYAHAHQFFFFVEEDGVGIFLVRGPVDMQLSAGDRVLVQGRTALGAQPFVLCESVKLLRHGGLPAPVSAHLNDLDRGKLDARWVKLSGVIQIADPPKNPNDTTYLQLFMDNSFVDVIVDGDLARERDKLQGAQVEINGVAAARLDDRARKNGNQIFVPSVDSIKILRSAPSAGNNAGAAITSLRSINALSFDETAKNLPVAFEATVTYFSADALMAIVQDDGIGIYMKIGPGIRLNLGDRVLVRGTMAPGFRPLVNCVSATILRHGALPPPVPANFDQLIHVQRDCLRVKVRAVLQAADLAWGPEGPTFLQLHTPQGIIDTYLDSNDARARNEMLDAEVDVTGVATAKLDGKGQETGVLLFVSSMDDIKTIKRADASFTSIPLSPMNEVITAHQVNDLSQRVRVRGTITYSQPGSSAVLQRGTQSLWIETQSNESLRIGDLAEATGFPTLHEGFLALARGVIHDTQKQAPITPAAATWKQLSASQNINDLVSTVGQVVTEIREDSQDEYVLVSDGNLFTAIYRHPGAYSPNQIEPMKMIPVGAKVRVTGICVLKDSNPYKGPVPFDILLRSFSDIVVIASPSWLNVRNLIILVCALLLVVFVVLVRGWIIEHKVRRQTSLLANLEQQRSQILEDINSSRPLAEILEKIVALVSFGLRGAPCWCEIVDGARLGTPLPDPQRFLIVREEIPTRSGPPLGWINVALDPHTTPGAEVPKALSMSLRLASLAIETRRLNEDLTYRSEFDLLTDIHNRFALDKYLDEQIVAARERAGVFGLIYIDLDKFKQVNDRYGHQIGDLYLHDVALRMKKQLRPCDMLARLGGDEFAALVPHARSRAEIEEIAKRLEGCFDEPFVFEDLTLHGSASLGLALYPQDGATKDSLLSAADAAMYTIKKNRQQHENAV
jgi:diguanylate cyclase (GGDEF)-like protein